MTLIFIIIRQYLVLFYDVLTQLVFFCTHLQFEFICVLSFLPFLCSAWRLLLLQGEIVYSPIRRQEFLRRWTVSLELSASYITWQRNLTCTVYETFEDTFACLGLRRIVISYCCFLRRVQIFLLTYLLIILLTWVGRIRDTTESRLAQTRCKYKNCAKIIRVSCQRCTWR